MKPPQHLRRNTLTVVFLLSAGLALAAFFLAYELRYMWYVSRENFIFLRSIFGVSVLTIILLWVFYPSRILVALVVLACFALPPLLRGAAFVQLDAASLGAVLLCALLVVGATELRRRSRKV